MKNLYFSQVSQFFSLCFNQPLGPLQEEATRLSEKEDGGHAWTKGAGMGDEYIQYIYIYNIYIQYIYIHNIYIYIYYVF